MSNIEKIRKEIERRKEYHWEYLPDADSPEDDWTHNELCELGAFEELEHLEDFIDSLPEEKPSEDLEEAAARYERENRQSILSSVDIVDAFIAGAEWQKEQMMDEWLKDRDGCFWDGVNEGKKAMEEQMMNGAVEVDVADLNGEIYNNCIEKGMTDEDKVKIIIVKK